MKKLIITVLCLVLALTPFSVFAAAPASDSMVENVVGTITPGQSRAYYDSHNSIGYVEGQNMSAAGYYLSRQYMVPVFSQNQKGGVLFLSTYINPFYFQDGLVYQFDVLLDVMYGGGQSINFDDFGMVFGRASDPTEATGSLDKWVKDTHYVFKPDSVEHVSGSFYRLSFTVPFNTEKYAAYFQSTEQNGRRYFVCDSFGIYDGNKENFNKYGYINFQCRMYYMYINVTSMTSDEYLVNESLEREKQEAQDSANDAVEEVQEAIQDDYSPGMLEALNNLMNVLSYNGTDSTWIFPSIVLPEIPGVMKSVKMNDEIPIDFSSWVDKVPDKYMKIVRSLSTIALVLYSFKELWSLVEYVISLKSGSSGGGLDE